MKPGRSFNKERKPSGPFKPKPAPEAPVQISLSRRAAFETLMRVEQGDAWASHALDVELERAVKHRGGDPERIDEDRRLAREITLGVLRRRGFLDAEITARSDRPISRIEPAARTALRMALYQIVFLTRIPESAAVNESVNLVKQTKEASHAVGFVNAVLREALRTSIRERFEAKLKAFEATAPETIRNWEPYEAVLSHPAWLLGHWARQWGAKRTVEIAKTDNLIAPTHVWLNPLRNDPTATRTLLESTGTVLGDTRHPHTVEWIQGDWSALRALVERGDVYVQDAASQAVARWVGVEPGMRVLDMCAAPGGKTAQLAAMMDNRGEIVALDANPRRVAELKENCARLGASIVTALTCDATDETALAAQLPALDCFDAVLLDAPCSGTGTLRRHPEIKWRLEAKKLNEFAELQQKLLKNAAKLVKPGGVLVYSTCSIEEREGEEQARKFRIRNSDFEVMPGSGAEFAPTDEGFLRTWPDQGPDGFFAARFRRKR